MKQWWQQLNEREQKLVASMAIVIAIFVLYSGIWQPLNDNISKTEQKIARQQQLLAWVNQNTSLYQQASKSSSTKQSGASLSSIINQTARRQSISIARIQPQGDDIQIWIDEVAFNSLLQWLELLANQQGLVVKNIDLSKGKQTGVVAVRRLQLGKS